MIKSKLGILYDHSPTELIYNEINSKFQRKYPETIIYKKL